MSFCPFCEGRTSASVATASKMRTGRRSMREAAARNASTRAKCAMANDGNDAPFSSQTALRPQIEFVYGSPTNPPASRLCFPSGFSASRGLALPSGSGRPGTSARESHGRVGKDVSRQVSDPTAGILHQPAWVPALPTRALGVAHALPTRAWAHGVRPGPARPVLRAGKKLRRPVPNRAATRGAGGNDAGSGRGRVPGARNLGPKAAAGRGGPSVSQRQRHGRTRAPKAR